jgi:hypothetical protein
MTRFSRSVWFADRKPPKGTHVRTMANANRVFARATGRLAGHNRLCLSAAVQTDDTTLIGCSKSGTKPTPWRMATMNNPRKVWKARYREHRIARRRGQLLFGRVYLLSHAYFVSNKKGQPCTQPS